MVKLKYLQMKFCIFFKVTHYHIGLNTKFRIRVSLSLMSVFELFVYFYHPEIHEHKITQLNVVQIEVFVLKYGTASDKSTLGTD